MLNNFLSKITVVQMQTCEKCIKINILQAQAGRRNSDPETLEDSLIANAKKKSHNHNSTNFGGKITIVKARCIYCGI